jgi:serine phosphatase RsbU (regulator of sigma subunit)
MAIIRRFPTRGLLAALILAIVVLPVTVGGCLWLFGHGRSELALATQIRALQRTNAELLKYQLDEETGVRGFALAHQRVYLGPYQEADKLFASLASDFRASVATSTFPPDLLYAADAQVRLHDEWDRAIARPSIAGERGRKVDFHRGKTIMDAFRRVNQDIDEKLSTVAVAHRDIGFVESSRGAALAIAAIVVLAVTAVLFALVQGRLEAQLAGERRATRTLQRAFMGNFRSLPLTDVGVAYRSATSGALVGGDICDLYPLSPTRVLVTIADVSGKGLAAAVDTAFVKYAIRTLAREYDRPSTILSAFNDAYCDEKLATGAFVVVFVAIVDLAEATLRYGSAGHSAAFFRRGDRVEMLTVTGPAIGIARDLPFGDVALPLKSGDVLMAATDGITESRDRAGRLLGDEGLASWFAAARLDASAQDATDRLISLALARSGGKLHDDVAMVVFRVVAFASAPAVV